MKHHLPLLLTLFHVSFAIAKQLDLPFDQLPFVLRNFPKLEAECQNDPQCQYKVHLNKDVCWGYEDDCKPKNSYSHPICKGDHGGWVKTKDEQVATFYKQADFGYVRSIRNSMTMICTPEYREDSSLECSDSLHFCRARNILIDFTSLSNRTKPVLYDMDVLKHGEIGGFCKFDPEKLEKISGSISPLQSWTPELQHFVQLDYRPSSSKNCDILIRRPTFIMKIDAPVNIYHHFCDFFNLYASLHVNATTAANPFDTNVDILIWRTYPYTSSIEATFRAFTDHPILNLDHFRGKKVCFSNAVFPLLPRMIYGLFYNTPLIGGCEKSGLFHAFSRFILHRLRVDTRSGPNLKALRVTLISRDTTYRKVLNENALIAELQKNPNYVVKKAKFTWQMDFIEQLKVIQNTDILIGMHGAGLTHLLFLPDWAAIFELYNCGDANCYKDLARLRGVKYLTWRNSSLVTQVDDPKNPPDFEGPHEKHTNYKFDPEEFAKIVGEGAEHVKREGRLLHSTHSRRDEL